MITLNDVLAAERSQDYESLHGLRGVVGRPRQTVYQTFFEAQEREGSPAERSPLVVWAKQNLQSNAGVAPPKLSGQLNAQVREVA